MSRGLAAGKPLERKHMESDGGEVISRCRAAVILLLTAM